MDETEIRRATVSDVDGFAASNAALFAEDGAARDHLRNPDWPGGHGARWCTDLIADPAALVLVAVSAGDVVGHLVATFAEPSDMWVEPRAELVSMHVSSVWRAQGLGSRLVEESVSWARGRGAARLLVSAYDANEGALRFYRSHGFAPLSSELALDL